MALSSQDKVGIGLFFIPLLVIPALFVNFSFARVLVNQTRALWFAETQGTVLTSSIETTNEDGIGYSPKVEYAYSIDGKEFSNDVVHFGFGMGSKTYAEQTVAENPVGSKIHVYFNEHDPKESSLEPGIQGTDLLFAVMMIPFNFLVFGILWAAIKIRSEGYGNGLETDSNRPYLNAAKWVLAACFASVILTWQMTDMNPSLNTMIGALVAIAMTGLGGFFWSWFRKN